MDYAAVLGALGVASGSQDIFAGYRNMLSYLNRHGGLAGHPVQPIFYRMNGASEDYASEVQAACAFLTQDHHANVVISIDASNFDGLPICLGHAGVAEIDLNQWASDSEGMASHPNLFLPDALGIDHSALTELDVALQRGWLRTTDLLGVVIGDCVLDNRVYNHVIVPWARRSGVKLDKATVSCSGGADGIATASGQIQNAVLRFRTDGVSVVTVVGAAEGGGVILFSQAASSQDWHPGYILTSNAFPDTNSGNFAADQEPKMRGIGWSPYFDVGLRATVGNRQAHAIEACHRMDPSDGDVSHAVSRQNGLEWFYSECDTVQLLRAMTTATHGDLGISALDSVYPAAAANTASAKNPAGAIGSVSGGRDGAAYVVPLSYKVGCKCFSHDGPAQQVTSAS